MGEDPEGCRTTKNAEKATTPLDGITVVPEPSAELRTERQQIDYRSQREQPEVAIRVRQGPEKADGYAHPTVRNRGHRIDQFYRWVWDQKDGYTTGQHG